MAYSGQEYHGQYRGQGQSVDFRASTPKDAVPILQYSNEMAFDGSYNYKLVALHSFGDKHSEEILLILKVSGQNLD